SPRLRELFMYLAECAIRDPQSPLTEHQVGIAVFKRPEGYDTSSDTVVRVQASELRKRLKYYFLSEGLHEPLVMELPRGSYLPVLSKERLKKTINTKDVPHKGEKETNLRFVAAGFHARLAPDKPASLPVKPAKSRAQFVLALLLCIVSVFCG